LEALEGRKIIGGKGRNIVFPRKKKKGDKTVQPRGNGRKKKKIKKNCRGKTIDLWFEVTERRIRRTIEGIGPHNQQPKEVQEGLKPNRVN